MIKQVLRIGVGGPVGGVLWAAHLLYGHQRGRLEGHEGAGVAEELVGLVVLGGLPFVHQPRAEAQVALSVVLVEKVRGHLKDTHPPDRYLLLSAEAEVAVGEVDPPFPGDKVGRDEHMQWLAPFVGSERAFECCYASCDVVVLIVLAHFGK